MKFSKQRELILETVKNGEYHLTADSIYNLLKIKNPNLSLGTVYRNLSLLSEHNIIRKVSLPNQPDKFDKNTHDHGHLFCEICGEIFDIDTNFINNLSSDLIDEGNLIKSYDIIMHGICKNCNK